MIDYIEFISFIFIMAIFVVSVILLLLLIVWSDAELLKLVLFVAIFAFLLPIATIFAKEFIEKNMLLYWW